MDETTKRRLEDKNSKVEIQDNAVFMTVNGVREKLPEAPIDVSNNIQGLHFCDFCGAPPGEDPLFTIDGTKFICKDCTILAYNTFVENGIPMPMNVKVTK